MEEFILTNIYNLIKLEYEKKRLRNYHKQQKCLNFVYSKIPEIEDIDYKIKKIGVKYSLSILNKSNGLCDVPNFNEAIKKLEEKKKHLLLANGFSSDFLDLRYDCPKCHDTGIMDDGLSICPCFRQQYINYIFGQSNLSVIKEENFKTFNEFYYSDKLTSKSKMSPRQNILDIKKIALSFIQSFEEEDTKNLLFTGNTGVGKTFMLNCIAYELLKKDKTVIYKTAFELFDTINKYKLQLGEKKDLYDYNQIFDVDLLVIDDLGAEPKSDSKHSELLNILNKRQIKNLKTIIATNLGLKEIYQEYSERVYSRIIEKFEILRFFGQDIRTIKSKEKKD